MGFVTRSHSSSNRYDLVVYPLIEEARDPATPWVRLLELVKHPEVEVRRALLDNPNLCPTDEDGKLYTRLLESLARQFPKEVAAHPLFVLHALIEPTHEFQGVVKEVVQRTVDVGLIEQLLSTWGSGSSDVRFSVAKNPATPVNVLRILGNEMTESEWRVREAVAQNPSTPEDLLRTLGNEQTESHGWVREAVAKNPTTPEDVLRTLGNEVTESLMYVRASVASNPNTPVGVLRTLGNQETESVWGVRQAVAKNPSTPVDTLHTLGSEQTESNKFVREAAQNALAARGLT